MKDRDWNRVSHRHLLVVDDSPDNQFIFARLLMKAELNLRLETSTSGAGAVSLLDRMQQNKGLPLVAFVDVRMPVMDGFALLRWIRARPAFCKMPVVMLTEHSEPSETSLAAELGAQAYLQKGLSPTQLRSIVEYAVDLASLNEPLIPIACRGNLISCS